MIYARELIGAAIEFSVLTAICAPLPAALFCWLRRIQRKEHRARWQFHLSTAMIMMLATGALFLVNTQEHVDINWEPEFIVKGWPMSFPEKHDHNFVVIIGNLFIAVSIILTIGFACELLILFQFRSSTTAVFIMATVALLLANSIDSHSNLHFYQNLSRGWPFKFYTSWTCHAEGLSAGILWNLIYDGAIAIAVLTAATLVAEWLFRQANRLKTAP